MLYLAGLEINVSIIYTLTESQISNPMLLGVPANWLPEAILSLSPHQVTT